VGGVGVTPHAGDSAPCTPGLTDVKTAVVELGMAMQD
jgi:hypothetical protein